MGWERNEPRLTTKRLEGAKLVQIAIRLLRACAVFYTMLLGLACASEAAAVERPLEIGSVVTAPYSRGSVSGGAQLGFFITMGGPQAEFSPSLSTPSGLVVEELSSDSPAAKAELQPGDRIISFDGKALASPAAFDALQQNTFGEKDVWLEVRRGEQSLKMTMPIGKLGMEVRPEFPAGALKLYQDGKLSLKAGNIKEAAAYFQAAASLAHEAWLYNRAGEILENRQLWKDAEDAHSAAWELLKDGSDAADKSRTLAALGWCHENQDDLTAAARSYEQARQVDMAAGNEMWVAEDLQTLGALAHTRGDFPAAQDDYNRALAIWERLRPNSSDVGEGLDWLTGFAKGLGDLPAAQDYATRSLAIAEHLHPGSASVADRFRGLGTVTSLRGDSLATQYYYSQSLAILERLQPNSRIVAIMLRDLARAAFARGDYEAAQHYLLRCLEINEMVVPHSFAVAEALDELSLNAAELGDFPAAQNYQKRALAIQERLAPNSPSYAATLNKLGRVACYRHDLASAEDYENRALAIQQRLAPNSSDAGNSLNELGHIAFERGDLLAARQFYDRALQIFEQSAPDSVQLVGDVADLGILNLRERRFSEARSLFERAVHVLESQRGRIGSPEARAFLVAEFKAAYEGLIQSSVALNDWPSAFGASERARARSLLDLLTEGRVDLRQGVDPVLLARERQLQESLNAKAEAQSKLLIGKHSEREAGAAAKEMDAVTTEYHEVEASIRAVSPRYAALTRPQPAGGIQNIPFPQLGPLTIAGGAAFWYAWAMVALAAWLATNLLRGQSGWAFEAIRNDELAAEAIGVPTRRYKIAAFTFAGGLAGFAGSFYSAYLGTIDPSAVGVSLSIDFLLMVVLGGAGGVAGAIMGATLIGVANVYGHELENWRPVIYGVLVIVVVVFFPNGLAGLVRRPRRRTGARVNGAAALARTQLSAPSAPAQAASPPAGLRSKTSRRRSAGWWRSTA